MKKARHCETECLPGLTDGVKQTNKQTKDAETFRSTDYRPPDAKKQQRLADIDKSYRITKKGRQTHNHGITEVGRQIREGGHPELFR